MKHLLRNKFNFNQENFKFTRLGLFLFILTIGIFILGYVNSNYGYILLGSVLVMAYILSYFGLILSLIFVKVYWIKKESFANQVVNDSFTLQNFSPFPYFNFKIVEKSSGKSETLRLIVPLLLPFEKKSFSQLIPFETRGEHEWSGIYLSSTFPCGFFEKKKKVFDSGKRFIWPEPKKANHLINDTSVSNDTAQSRRVKNHLLWGGTPSGSVRPYQAGDNASSVNWKKSIQLKKIVIWEKQLERNGIKLHLNIDRLLSAIQLEQEISNITYKIIDLQNKYKTEESSYFSLIVNEKGHFREIHGYKNILDVLSLIKKNKIQGVKSCDQTS